MPGSKLFLVSEYKSAALKVTKQKLDEIWSWFPQLKNELEYDHMSNDYLELKFKNGSFFFIVSLTAASRGQRSVAGVIEEAALIKFVLIPEKKIGIRKKFNCGKVLKLNMPQATKVETNVEID